MFILHNEPKLEIHIPGFVIEQLELDSGSAKFDLSLEIVEQEQGGFPYRQFEYSSELFECSTV